MRCIFSVFRMFLVERGAYNKNPSAAEDGSGVMWKTRYLFYFLLKYLHDELPNMLTLCVSVCIMESVKGGLI